MNNKKPSNSDVYCTVKTPLKIQTQFHLADNAKDVVFK